MNAMQWYAVLCTVHEDRLYLCGTFFSWEATVIDKMSQQGVMGALEIIAVGLSCQKSVLIGSQMWLEIMFGHADDWSTNPCPCGAPPLCPHSPFFPTVDPLCLDIDCPRVISPDSRRHPLT